MFDGTQYDIQSPELTPSQSAARKRRKIILGVLKWIVQRYRCYAARAEQRRALRDLDDRLLRDIGVTPEQRTHECGKPFWL